MEDQTIFMFLAAFLTLSFILPTNVSVTRQGWMAFFDVINDFVPNDDDCKKKERKG